MVDDGDDRAGRDPAPAVTRAIRLLGLLADARHPLTRGVDFAMIPRSHGGPTLVLHDMAQKFEASYSSNFADALAAR